MQINLLGYPLPALKKLFEEYGFSALDAKRVYPWIHNKLSFSFAEMSDLPAAVRPQLAEKFSLSRGECERLQISKDGTRKALLKFSDGNLIETVFIPEATRSTICVSSQVGCAMGCKFCHTGTQNFTRNLSASEIMAQVFFWKDLFPISNIVFMGMGEPMLNAANLFDVLAILLDNKTHNFSRHKITVSTCGIVCDQLNELAKFGVKLAISLHAPNDEIRSTIMPINNKFKIADVLESAKKYQKASNTERITFEYLMLDGVNDSVGHAKELVKLLHGLPAKVNLIKYNDWDGSRFKGSSAEKINTFSAQLTKHGLQATIRKSKGDDILAACGQLKAKGNHGLKPS